MENNPGPGHFHNGSSVSVDDKKPITSVKESANTFSVPDQKEKPRKSFLIYPILIVFLISLGFAAYFSIRNKHVAKAPGHELSGFDLKANVIYMTGEVYSIVDDRKVEIKEKDTLKEGDIIITGQNTYLVLGLDEGTIIRAADETRFALTKLSAREIVISEESGTLFVRTDKDNEHRFIIKAGDVAVESLGTVFSVEYYEEVSVKVFENEVAVIQEGKKEVLVGENKQWESKKNEISDFDYFSLESDGFYNLSLSEEKILVPSPTPLPQATSAPLPKTENSWQIYLTGSSTDKGINLNWTVNGLDVSKGFKIIKNLEGNPSYPGSSHIKFVSSDTRSLFWEITDGKKWYFRVCQYLGSGCGVYSNEISLTSSTKSSQESKVGSISLYASKISDGKANLSWSVDGISVKGYKVVWSNSPGPSYPTRKGDWFVYLSHPDSRDYDIGGLEPGKTYYFRVCEYLDGTCKTYSNEVSLSF